jgi:hypothetical protein
MRKIMVLGITVALCWMAWGTKAAMQEQTPSAEAKIMKPYKVPEEATETAKRYLPLLSKLATEETFKGMGYESLSEVQASELGTPAPMFMVRLDRLKEYEPKTDPVKLLVDTNKILYPIHAGGKVRSGMILREVDGKWSVSSVGKATFTQAFARAYKKQEEAVKGPGGSIFEVEIPALHLYFAGRRAESGIALTSLQTSERFKLEEGQTMPAQELFGRIAPLAREIRTGPNIVD